MDSLPDEDKYDNMSNVDLADSLGSLATKVTFICLS